MFCYQCEQTAKGQGCTATRVCGKDPRTAAVQDLLLHAVNGVPRPLVGLVPQASIRRNQVARAITSLALSTMRKSRSPQEDISRSSSSGISSTDAVRASES